MHMRLLSILRRKYLLSLAFAVMLAVATSSRGQSQVHIPAAAFSTPTAAAHLLEEGQELEREARWLEALSLYDDAVRQFPQDEQLKLRKTLAHVHCDLDRRLADSSYHRLCETTTLAKSLQLYDEIGQKVETHYVGEPDWQRVVWRGTANLDVAVTKSEFAGKFMPGVSPEQVNAFRHELRDDVNKRVVRSRREAHDLAAYTAALAVQRLGIPQPVTIGEYCCGAISCLISTPLISPPRNWTTFTVKSKAILSD